MTQQLKVKLFLFAIFLIWILFLFSEPFFLSTKYGLISYPFVKKGLNLVCHQEEAKLIQFFGFQTFVCTRCIGLYSGVLFGLIISLIIQIKPETNHKLFAASIAIIMVDILIYDYLSLYSYNKIIAFLTGLFLGSTVFNYFWDSLTNINGKN